MSDIKRLLDVMARLRDPEEGCPWDVEQDFASIAPYTVEEAYEVEDAIRRGDSRALCDELGDLLLQVVYHAQMAREAGDFAFGDVVEAICDKLVRRHPNVFGDVELDSPDARTRAWEEEKARERAERGDGGVVDGIPLGLPALMRARKLLSRAERVGEVRRDPGHWEPRFARALQEFRGQLEVGDGGDPQAALGDFLSAVVGLAWSAHLDPEAALRDASARMEAELRARHD
ncbi:MAG: nucleoside triphosphate pyrophosphohydrolase [Myxococcota bacterium]